MRHTLIIISISLFSSFLVSCEKNGPGTETYVDGSSYEGVFKDGTPHGQGTYTWSNGQKYVGEFKDGKPHGQGTFTLPDGSKYVGEYKYGNRHGQGTFTFHNGRKNVREWRFGKGWNTTNYDKEGNTLGKYVNGKWIKN